MPLVPRLIVGSLLVLAGLAVLVVAVLGARGRLRRNRWVGVRTAATMRSAAAWSRAQRVGAVPQGAAGGVVVVAGAVVLGGAGAALSSVVGIVACVAGLLLAGYGGLVGHRAAENVAAAAAPAACSGACAGCDLVAGCRDGSAAASIRPRERHSRPNPLPERAARTERDDTTGDHRTVHQPQEPGPPLNGPTTSRVTQPP